MAILPRVFTIPASVQFLPTLIAALVGGELVPGFSASGDPLSLARASLYLPTRRACRLARDLFLDALGTDATLLPRILPIGDIDEDELAFAEAAAGSVGAAALELPEALGGLQRRFLLAQLVMSWAASPEVRGDGGAPLVAQSPAAALALADNLARLIDDMTTRQVAWERLDDLVPDRFDQYWQLTLRFLKIAREQWPRILTAHGAIEPAERRDRLIKAEADRLAALKDGPVIAAGSTGSMPATAMLLETIARLPHGAVVLPGLDTDLHADAWELIGGTSAGGRVTVAPAVGHPQFAMRALLKQIGIERAEVKVLGKTASTSRERLVSHALCPAAASERWQERLSDDVIVGALEGVTVIQAANAEDEALAIAVALRAKVEQPGKVAALVTPDRALARRVVAALARWKVAVDDSGGDALADTQAGLFARLAGEAALGGLEPVTLLALLKHPLYRVGAEDGRRVFATNTIERAILRGPRPKAGTSGLVHALATFRREQSSLHRRDPRTTLTAAELDAAASLAAKLATALAPLEELRAKALPFTEIAARHRKVIEALGGDASGNPSVFAGSDGAALATAFDEIATNGGALSVAPADYLELFEAAISDRAVRWPEAPGVRVRIFGLLEARLQNVDLMVLGGLAEGTWPPEAHNDAWLSRPMRHDLGLNLPELRISLSAHDFAQALGAREVILTRAAKVAGAPTLWSRFVQRLAAVAGEGRWKEAVARGDSVLAWSRGLDHPASVDPVKRPAPTPARAARPISLSVTEIEHWLRDPYTIYAKHILRLAPLDAVDTPPGARDRGTVIHGAIGDFTEKFTTGLPPDPVGTLLALGEEHFATLADYPEARAFWWPRFKRIANWFVAWEAARRGSIAAIHAEIDGRIEIPLGDRMFTLRTRADRIERLADGRYTVLDYKTGRVPSDKEVKVGLAPQLTLEAAILRNGGFGDIPAGASVAELVYVGLKGGEPAGKAEPVDLKKASPDEEADNALRKLTEVAARFEDESQPYYSLLMSMWSTRYGDYDHLARVKEWSATGGENEAME